MMPIYTKQEELDLAIQLGKDQVYLGFALFMLTFLVGDLLLHLAGVSHVFSSHSAVSQGELVAIPVLAVFAVLFAIRKKRKERELFKS